ncbi:MAG: exodeoxyribonuclease V subunit alpha [Parachlamydiales bacterium]
METVSSQSLTPLEALASHWPILQQSLLQEIIDPIDVILTGHILEGRYAELEEACAICHLSLAVRSGHLCVKWEEGKIEPSPELFWDTLAKNIFPYIEKGLKKLIEENANSYLSVYGSALYFQRYVQLEEQCAELFNSHQRFHPTILLNAASFDAYLSHHPALLKEQKDAISKVLHQTISFITGGPGTGKTFTASCLIEAIGKSLPEECRASFEIALAAPTGKAASHLHQKIIAQLPDVNALISSSTIHSLLNISSSTKEFKKKLSHDLVVVDESSMIDLKLMTALLCALKPGARLVLLGDHRQLPPVEPGAPFNDLISARFKSADIALQPGYLKTCMRAELKEIVHFAEEIDRGDLEAVKRSLNTPGSAVQGKLLPEARAFNQTVQYLSGLFPSLLCTTEYPDMQVLKSFRLLTPLRKGVWGVESLNQALHKTLLAQLPVGASPAIPILLTTNDHQLQLYNGDMGFLWKGQGYFAASDGSWRIIPTAILPKYQYGYCLSVHKSQGSEFDRIAVLLPPGTEVLGRSSLYTAVTRAKQSVELWYDPVILEATIRQDKLRISNLSRRIE